MFGINVLTISWQMIRIKRNDYSVCVVAYWNGNTVRIRNSHAAVWWTKADDATGEDSLGRRASRWKPSQNICCNWQIKGILSAEKDICISDMCLLKNRTPLPYDLFVRFFHSCLSSLVFTSKQIFFGLSGDNPFFVWQRRNRI